MRKWCRHSSFVALVVLFLVITNPLGIVSQRWGLDNYLQGFGQQNDDLNAINNVVMCDRHIVAHGGLHNLGISPQSPYDQEALRVSLSVFDLTSHTWTVLTPKSSGEPPPALRASVVGCFGSVVLVAGGELNEIRYNDTHTYSLTPGIPFFVPLTTMWAVHLEEGVWRRVPSFTTFPNTDTIWATNAMVASDVYSEYLLVTRMAFTKMGNIGHIIHKLTGGLVVLMVDMGPVIRTIEASLRWKRRALVNALAMAGDVPGDAESRLARVEKVARLGALMLWEQNTVQHQRKMELLCSSEHWESKMGFHELQCLNGRGRRSIAEQDPLHGVCGFSWDYVTAYNQSDTSSFFVPPVLEQRVHMGVSVIDNSGAFANPPGHGDPDFVFDGFTALPVPPWAEGKDLSKPHPEYGEYAVRASVFPYFASFKSQTTGRKVSPRPFWDSKLGFLALCATPASPTALSPGSLRLPPAPYYLRNCKAGFDDPFGPCLVDQEGLASPMRITRIPSTSLALSWRPQDVELPAVAMVDLRSGATCRLRLMLDSISEIPDYRKLATITVVRVPVWEVRKVSVPSRNTGGVSTVWEASTSPPTKELPRLHGWRTVALFGMGCPRHEGQGSCYYNGTRQDGKSRTHAGYFHALDITPLLDGAPDLARMGFDDLNSVRPRYKSPHDLPQRSDHPLWYNVHHVDVDGDYVNDMIEYLEARCGRDTWRGQGNNNFREYYPGRFPLNEAEPEPFVPPEHVPDDTDDEIGEAYNGDARRVKKEWHLRFFRSLFSDVPCNTSAKTWDWMVDPSKPDDLQYCQAPSLRWHRINAAGFHTASDSRGLHILLPPKDTHWAVLPENASTRVCNTSTRPWSDIPSTYFGETTYTGPSPYSFNYHVREAACSASLPLRRTAVPSLVAPLSTSRDRGIQYTYMQPVGRLGPMGAHGAPSVVIFGGERDGVEASMGYGYLELYATVPAPSEAMPSGRECIVPNSSVPWDDAIASCAADPLMESGVVMQPFLPPRSNPSSSKPRPPLPPLRYVDDAVQFWGSFHSGAQPVGSGAESLGGRGSATISPPQRISDPLLYFSQHPLLQLMNESMLCGKTGQGMPTLYAVAAQTWNWTISHRMWGATALGRDLLFLDAAGFPRNPLDTLRLMEEVTVETITQPPQWLVLTGGCSVAVKDPLDGLFCSEIGSLLARPRGPSVEDTIQLLMSASSRVRTAVDVFDPQTMVWVPSDVHKIPPLPVSLFHHSVLVFGTSLMVIGGFHYTAGVVEFYQPESFALDLMDDSPAWDTVSISTVASDVWGTGTFDSPTRLFQRSLASTLQHPCPAAMNATDCWFIVGGVYANSSRAKAAFFGGENIHIRDLFVLEPQDTVLAVSLSRQSQWHSLVHVLHPIFDAKVAIRGIATGVSTCRRLLASATIVGQMIVLIGGLRFSGDDTINLLSTATTSSVCVIDTITGNVVDLDNLINLKRVPSGEQPGSVLNPMVSRIGRSLVVVGGSRSDYSFSAWAFDVSTLAWVPLTRYSRAEGKRLVDSPPFHTVEVSVMGEGEGYRYPTMTVDGFHYSDLPDFHGSGKHAPLERSMSGVIQVRDRLYFVGGFSSSFSVTNEVAVLWTGLSVGKSIQAGLQRSSEKEVSAQDAAASFAIVSMLDGFCSGYLSVFCGSLEATVAQAIERPAPWVLGPSEVRGDIEVTGTQWFSRLKIDKPLVLRSVSYIARWSPLSEVLAGTISPTLRCINSPFRRALGYGETCLQVDTAVGRSSIEESFELIDIVIEPLSISQVRDAGRNTAVNSTAIRLLNCFQSSISLTRATVSRFGAEDSGGASVIEFGGGLLADQCLVHVSKGSIFDQCSALYGGAMFLRSSSLLFVNSILKGCASSYAGGAISASCSSIKIHSSSVVCNGISPRSGAIVESSDFPFHGGGGVLCSGDGSIDVFDSNLLNNSVFGDSDGGAVKSISCRLNIRNSTMQGNYAIGYGGALFAQESEVQVAASLIENNGAFMGAGGIGCENCAVLDLHSSSVLSNRAGLRDSSACFPADSGVGGVSVRGSTTTLGRGGGLLLLDDQPRSLSVTVNRTVFVHNTATTDGGAIAAVSNLRSWQSASAEYGDATCFSDQQADEESNGGSKQLTQDCLELLLQSSENGAPLSFDGEILRDNSALDGGGDLFLEGYAIWPGLLAPQGAKNKSRTTLAKGATWTGSAAYGDAIATEPRYVVVANRRSVEANATDPYKQISVSPRVILLDGLFQRINGSRSNLLVQVEHISTTINANSCEAYSSLTRFGEALQVTVEGETEFEGLVFRAPPLSEVQLRFTTLVGGTLVPSIPLTLRGGDCEPGFVFREGIGCIPCPAGFIREPLSCTCEPCFAGSREILNRKMCSLCEPGTWSSSGSGECSPCEPHQFSGIGWSACSICAEGTDCTSGTIALPEGKWAVPSTLSTLFTLPPSIIIDIHAWYHQFRDTSVEQSLCLPPWLLQAFGIDVPPDFSAAPLRTEQSQSCWDVALELLPSPGFERDKPLDLFAWLPASVASKPLHQAPIPAELLFRWWSLTVTGVDKATQHAIMSTPFRDIETAAAFISSEGLAAHLLYKDFREQRFLDFDCVPPWIFDVLGSEPPSASQRADGRATPDTLSPNVSACWESSFAVRSYPLFSPNQPMDLSSHLFNYWPASTQVKDTPLVHSKDTFMWWAKVHSKLFHSTVGNQLTTRELDIRELRSPTVLMGLTSTTVLLNCLIPSACTRSADLAELKCAKGYTGPLCGICTSGYVSNYEGVCDKCAENVLLQRIAVGLTFIGLVIGLAVYIYVRSRSGQSTAAAFEALEAAAPSQRPRLMRSASGFSHRRSRHCHALRTLSLKQSLRVILKMSEVSRDAALRILLSWMQMSTIVASLEPERSQAENMLLISLPTFDALSFRCLTEWTYLERLITYILVLPVSAVSIVLGAVFLISFRHCSNKLNRRHEGPSVPSPSLGQKLRLLTSPMHRKDGEEKRAKRCGWTSSKLFQQTMLGVILVVFLLYASILTAIFGAFRLSPYPEVPRLVADMRLESGTTEYSQVVGAAALCGVLYVVLVPLGLAIYLFRRNHKLYEESMLKTYGFLYLGYKRSSWFWEFTVLFRKGLIGFVAAALPSTSGGLVVTIALMAALLAQATIKPYINPLLNFLEMFALCNLTIVSVSFLYSTSADTNSATRALGSSLEFLGFVVSLLFFAISAALVVAGWLPYVKDYIAWVRRRRLRKQFSDARKDRVASLAQAEVAADSKKSTEVDPTIVDAAHTTANPASKALLVAIRQRIHRT